MSFLRQSQPIHFQIIPFQPFTLSTHSNFNPSRFRDCFSFARYYAPLKIKTFDIKRIKCASFQQYGHNVVIILYCSQTSENNINIIRYLLLKSEKSPKTPRPIE